MSSKVAFHTLGCKLNFSETSTIAGQFVEKGFDIVEYQNKADVYVINTCTVTENANRECRQIVRRALRNNPNAYIIVTGCYAQLSSDEIMAIEGVDAVLGNNEKFEIFSLISDFKKDTPSCIFISPTEDLDTFNLAFSTDNLGRTRAFFKIQDGCDYKCTFCTIPLARGQSRSADQEAAIAEFKKLVDAGYKEIILTGVNVGDYGKRIDTDLYSLLNKLVEIEGDFRIRISSIEPNLLTDEIIELTSHHPKMAKHFHIPLQSGSNKMLKLMQRRYLVEDYRTLIDKIVKKVDNVGIGVDVIVGSPGETEEDFIDTCNFIDELPISYLHVFTYSERPNTKAIEMDGVVEIPERKRRNNILRILSEKKRNTFYKKMINEEATILFEEENQDGFMYGWTSNYARVKHPYNEELTNSLTKNKIEGLDENICTLILNSNPITSVAG